MIIFILLLVSTLAVHYEPPAMIEEVPYKLFVDREPEIATFTDAAVILPSHDTKQANCHQIFDERGISGSRAKVKWTTVKVKHKRYLGRFFITHYCPCSRCCGVGGGKITASGTKPTAGRTVGVNPRLIKYGTKLKVGKKSGYVAEDTGGGIGWKHLDIFCNSHQEALQAGVGYEDVWAISYETKQVRLVEKKCKPARLRKFKEFLEVTK